MLRAIVRGVIQYFVFVPVLLYVVFFSSVMERDVDLVEFVMHGKWHPPTALNQYLEDYNACEIKYKRSDVEKCKEEKGVAIEREVRLFLSWPKAEVEFWEKNYTAAQSLCLVIMFFWYGLAGWTREKTAMHDIICGTRVILGRSSKNN